MASSKTAARAGAVSSSSAAFKNVCLDAGDPRVEELQESGTTQDGLAVLARRDDSDLPASRACGPDELHRVVEHLDTLLGEMLDEVPVLAIAEPADRLCVGCVARVTVRQLDAAGPQEGVDAVVTASAVDIVDVVRRDVERFERLTVLAPPPLEEVIEEVLPRRGVDRRRLCDHAVEVEEQGVVPEQVDGLLPTVCHLFPPRNPAVFLPVFPAPD
jgi:hypothetical protein